MASDGVERPGAGPNSSRVPRRSGAVQDGGRRSPTPERGLRTCTGAKSHRSGSPEASRCTPAAHASGPRRDRDRAQWPPGGPGSWQESAPPRPGSGERDPCGPRGVPDARRGGHGPSPARAPGVPARPRAGTGGRAGGSWHPCRPHTQRQFGSDVGRRGPAGGGRSTTDDAGPARRQRGVRSGQSGGRCPAARGHHSRTTRPHHRNRPARYPLGWEANAVVLE
jgi:hypothetical protein